MEEDFKIHAKVGTKICNPKKFFVVRPAFVFRKQIISMSLKKTLVGETSLCHSRTCGKVLSTLREVRLLFFHEEQLEKDYYE